MRTRFFFMSPPDRCTRSASAVNIEDMDEPAAQSTNDQARATRIRAATLGQLGAQIAHDFNNVLAVALTSIEMAMRVGDPEKASLFLGNALRVIARGADIDRSSRRGLVRLRIDGRDRRACVASRLTETSRRGLAGRVRMLAEFDALRAPSGRS